MAQSSSGLVMLVPKCLPRGPCGQLSPQCRKTLSSRWHHPPPIVQSFRSSLVSSYPLCRNYFLPLLGSPLLPVLLPLLLNNNCLTLLLLLVMLYVFEPQLCFLCLFLSYNSTTLQLLVALLILHPCVSPLHPVSHCHSYHGPCSRPVLDARYVRLCVCDRAHCLVSE